MFIAIAFRGLKRFGAVLLAVIIGVLFFSATSCMAYDLLIGTGERGTFSHFAGKRICHSLNSFSKDLHCLPVPMENYAAAVTNVQSGALDFALVNDKMIHDALNSRGVFHFLDINYDALRLLAPLYREPVVLYVRRDAGIATLDDLLGKRVNGGPVFSMANIVFDTIKQVKGWRDSDFAVYQTLSPMHSQDYIDFNNGKVEAMVHFGMHPDKKLARQMKESKGAIVGVYDDEIKGLIAANAGFCSTVIEPGDYAAVTEKINTLAIKTLLITSVDTNEETARLLLEALFVGKKGLQRAHPAILGRTVTAADFTDTFLPPHPAALAYFQGK